MPLGEHESVLCVESGVWLVRDDDGPLVAMLKNDDHGMGEHLALEIMAADRDRGERMLSDLWKLMRERNVSGRTRRTWSRAPRQRSALSQGGRRA